MKAYNILAIAAAVVIALLIAAPMAESDAKMTLSNYGSTTSFSDRDGGSIPFDVVNTGNETLMHVVITEIDTAKTVWEGDVKIEDGSSETTTTNVSIKIASGVLSVGHHELRVSCTSTDSSNPVSGKDTFTVSIDVKESLVSKWTTYVIIAIVVIIIAILAYIKIRDTPKSENTMTFEELEAQRKAEMAEKAEKKKNKSSSTSGPSTERKRYLAEKKKGKD